MRMVEIAMNEYTLGYRVHVNMRDDGECALFLF
jgi:hypothetical protein